MADEPLRRAVGALAAELERQREAGHRQTLWLHGPDTDGQVDLNGTVGLMGLAKALLQEVGTITRCDAMTYGGNPVVIRCKREAGHPGHHY